ncbi:MAG TPA: phosphate ABC transporter substrate-binding protein PstS [Candidatus Binatia bacterium]|nr:phosphate ABC transporter substrate-binding protein PstS [Candidatus Binatia bacterium]
MNVRRHAGIGMAVIAGAVLVSACGSTSTVTPPPSSSAAATTTPSASGSPSAAAIPTGNPTSAVNLTEDGSSLLYPYLQKLAPGLSGAYSMISLSPGPGGSGKGLSDAEQGNVLMGGSDAYMSAAVQSQYPNLENIPIAVSSQAVNYNIPGLSTSTNLKLSGDVIAKIYTGGITKWNDPAIAALNPGVTLPSTTIVPVRRADSSGDTFIFTSFLSATNSAWQSGPGFGTSLTNWPAVTGELTASGNPAMVTTCQKTVGCIAYIGISVEATAQASSANGPALGEAALENQAGNFVLPTSDNVTAAVDAGASSTPDNLAQSLIYQTGANSYPIVNFEYLIVNDQQSSLSGATGSSSDRALALRTFFLWAIDPNGGASSTDLSAVNFVALPTSVIPKVQAAIAKISG